MEKVQIKSNLFERHGRRRVSLINKNMIHAFQDLANLFPGISHKDYLQSIWEEYNQNPEFWERTSMSYPQMLPIKGLSYLISISRVDKEQFSDLLDIFSRYSMWDLHGQRFLNLKPYESYWKMFKVETDINTKILSFIWVWTMPISHQFDPDYGTWDICFQDWFDACKSWCIEDGTSFDKMMKIIEEYTEQGKLIKPTLEERLKW